MSKQIEKFIRNEVSKINRNFKKETTEKNKKEESQAIHAMGRYC